MKTQSTFTDVGWDFDTIWAMDGVTNEGYPYLPGVGLSPLSLSYTAGPNGCISGETSQTVIRGEDGSEVLAIPDTGYYFISWSDGVTDNPRSDTNITRNISVLAEFGVVGLSGKVIGVVAGYSDLPIREAQVTLVSASTGEERTVVTNADGVFSLEGPFTGQYTLSVSSPGFAPFVQEVTPVEGQPLDLGTLPAMSFESMYTQEELEQAVAEGIAEYIFNSDGKIGLAEIVFGLQVLVGVR